MLSIDATWTELAKLTDELEIFKQVVKYPFSRVNQAKFIEDLPALKLPACLLVFRGGPTDVQGGGRTNTRNWSAIFIVKDTSGDGFTDAVAFVDRFIGDDDTDGVLDQQTLDDELTIMGSADTRATFTKPEFSVYEVTFTTMESNLR